MRGTFLTEELLAFQEGLCFTESVSQLVSYPGSLYSRVLGMMFLPKSEKVTGGWR